MEVVSGGGPCEFGCRCDCQSTRNGSSSLTEVSMVTDCHDIAGSEVSTSTSSGVVVITPGELSCSIGLQDFARG